ncbi:MAG: inositol monophosphatase family protein [Negativicutes bacterium]|nr:inositol monophosphatase family protein [Negativicutes bacterium]
MIDLVETLARVKEIVFSVGKMQKENLGRSNLKIEAKSSSIDLVTEIDKKSEEAIVDFIRRHYPSHAILAEESGRTADVSEYLWIIDPIDGTTNYAQGLPIFAISVALQYREETVLGVVYCPVTEQLFTAIRGQGAYLNGEKIHVSGKQKLIDCVLATGFPYDIAQNPANNIDYFSAIVLKARAVRRIGSAAYDVCCVAAGKFDGYWELKVSLWDVAAAMLMVEEAGGQIIHFRQDRGISIIAGSATICEMVHREIKIVDTAAKG